MNKIDINALKARSPDEKGMASGDERRAGRARPATSSADIDYGDAAFGLASRAAGHNGGAGEATFPIKRDMHHAQAHGAPHPARHTDPSQAGLSRKELIAALAKPKQLSSINGMPRRDGRAVTVGPDSPEVLPDAGERDGQAVLVSCVGEMAAIGSASEKTKNELGHKSRGVRKHRGNDEHCAGGADDGALLTALQRGLFARADRVHYLAMAAMAGILLLRPPALGAATTLPAIKPQSRTECQRRCGTDGFCDPSDPLGCGGEYCAGRQT